MTIKELISEAHETAIAKGWRKRTPTGELEVRDIAEQVCLFHSEVSEALEAFRDSKYKPHEIWEGEGGKPEGMGIELADLLIRMADSCGAYKIYLGEDFLLQPLATLDFDTYFTAKTIPGLLCQLHSFITDLGRKWKAPQTLVGPFGDMWGTIFNLVGRTMMVVAHETDDASTFIERCVTAKLAYNKGRSFRHGNKRC